MRYLHWEHYQQACGPVLVSILTGRRLSVVRKKLIKNRLRFKDWARGSAKLRVNNTESTYRWELARACREFGVRVGRFTPFVGNVVKFCRRKRTGTFFVCMRHHVAIYSNGKMIDNNGVAFPENYRFKKNHMESFAKVAKRS